MNDEESYFPLVSLKASRAIYGKPPTPLSPLSSDHHSMDVDDFDDAAENLDYAGSMRAPSTAPSTGATPAVKKKAPMLSGRGASRLSSQSNEDLPDRTLTSNARRHIPPVPHTYTYSRHHICTLFL